MKLEKSARKEVNTLDTTKFKVLEVIIRNRRAAFDDKRIALMTEFPEMSWEEICSYISVLKKEEYLATLYGDDELLDVLVQPSALARLHEAKETAQSQKVRDVIDGILKTARILALL